ncbi:hypothetical protein PanWU01x14_259680 [Parasponia andersonii]|uniref:Uncharacterized protein n=1 Tax=Parasponia andersonii TaxID=3476 RepID=A0A2P5B986_PARAD|nr:hypothetical protein PanWU01x14_259680 [Parasponia andersonii]
MDCLVLPVSILKSRCMGSRLSYRPLADEAFGEQENPVTVVVGKEKREFLVDPYVLEENPFRVLIETMNKDRNNKTVKSDDFLDGKKNDKKKTKRVVFVDVDAILFEHMLWLMYNDCSSLFKLNLLEIIDFYAQDT